MTHARLLDHLETAVLQEDPARRLRLAGIVLANDPSNPLAAALVALSVADLGRAAPMIHRVADATRRAGSLDGASPALRAVVEVVRATRDMAALDPHSVVERLSRLAGGDLPGTVLAPALRLLLSAAAATGDVETLDTALKRASACPGLKREAAWFGYVLAKRLGKPDADALLEAAESACPWVRAVLDGDAPMRKPGNPGAFADGDVAVVLAAVLPGLFQAGGLPARKRVARAA